MTEQNVDILDTMFEVNRQQIDAILKYREGGGYERVAETSRRLLDLGEQQLTLLQLMLNRDKQQAKAEGDERT